MKLVFFFNDELYNILQKIFYLNNILKEPYFLFIFFSKWMLINFLEYLFIKTIHIQIQNTDEIKSYTL